MLYPGLIQVGSTNDVAVKAIKKRLNELNLASLDVNNGNFGESTKSAVIQFQKSRNLVPDGVVGELTWKTLFEAIIVAPVSAPNLADRAVEYALSQLKVRETTGRNDGAAVESYLASVNLGKGYAWCAAFVYWCFSQAAKDLGVPNPLVKTAGVLDHWNKAVEHRVSAPYKRGDIMIMDFGKGNGHTGLVLEASDTRLFTVEGNTGADPSTPASDREGDGVYKRNRSISSIKGCIRY